MDTAQMQQARDAARQTQFQKQTRTTHSTHLTKQSSVTSQDEASNADVKAWLQDIKKRRGACNRSILNKRQFELVTRIAEQVCKELCANHTNDYNTWKPLRWSMHGGPGAGKSHVIKTIKTELLEKVLNYNINVDFHVVALQNVMADLLDGDRIHHALNLIVCQHKNESNSSEFKKTT